MSWVRTVWSMTLHCSWSVNRWSGAAMLIRFACRHQMCDRTPAPSAWPADGEKIRLVNRVRIKDYCRRSNCRLWRRRAVSACCARPDWAHIFGCTQVCCVPAARVGTRAKVMAAHRWFAQYPTWTIVSICVALWLVASAVADICQLSTWMWPISSIGLMSSCGSST